jgi:hypothetical protein
MYLLAIVILYVSLSIKFLDWKRWKDHYATIQFFIIGCLLYNVIFYQHTLWAYKSVTWDWLGHTLISIIFTLIIIPIAIMFYLQYYPNGKKQVLYIFTWVAYFTSMEFLFSRLGMFVYDNGWNVGWSLLFNIIMFTMLRLHDKRPLLALILSVPIIVILLMYFHPPLAELK